MIPELGHLAMILALCFALVQAVVPLLPDDTAESLAARVLTQEHLIYPRAVLAHLLSKI